MATLTKTFHFATSAEGWTASPGNASIEMAWYGPHKKRNRLANIGGKQNAPLLQTMGGSLRTTAKQGNTAQNNYWEYSGTWESLGVPSGATVTAVEGDYLYRVDLRGVKPTRNSDATWDSTSKFNYLASGPFELCDSGGSLIGEFSTIQKLPTRTSGGATRYPTGGSNAVALKPANWADRTSESTLSISHASSVSVKLRLKNRMPPTGSGTEKWIRFKQDYVVLRITYTPATTAPNWFFSM